MSTQRPLPEQPTGLPIGTYPTYAKAQEAVDYLSDNQFPVENVTIVGTDLRLVERVTGRLTAVRRRARRRPDRCDLGPVPRHGRHAVRRQQRDPHRPVVTLLIGAGFGALSGSLAYGATGGKRDFTSHQRRGRDVVRGAVPGPCRRGCP